MEELERADPAYLRQQQKELSDGNINVTGFKRKLEEWKHEHSLRKKAGHFQMRWKDFRHHYEQRHYSDAKIARIWQKRIDKGQFTREGKSVVVYVRKPTEVDAIDTFSAARCVSMVSDAQAGDVNNFVGKSKLKMGKNAYLALTGTQAPESSDDSENDLPPQASEIARASGSGGARQEQLPGKRGRKCPSNTDTPHMSQSSSSDSEVGLVERPPITRLGDGLKKRQPSSQSGKSSQLNKKGRSDDYSTPTKDKGEKPKVSPREKKKAASSSKDDLDLAVVESRIAELPTHVVKPLDVNLCKRLLLWFCDDIISMAQVDFVSGAFGSH